MPTARTFAPGARVVIRDAEWIIKRVDRSATGGESLQVVGVSGIVREDSAVPGGHRPPAMSARPSRSTDLQLAFSFVHKVPLAYPRPCRRHGQRSARSPRRADAVRHARVPR